jgi:glycosyltransferase 2 family protein
MTGVPTPELAQRRLRLPAGLHRALRLAVPLILIGVIWGFVDSEDTIARLRAAEVGWLIVAVLAANVQTVLSAVRWRLVARTLGVPLALGQSVREYYVSQLVNQTVPGGVVGDATRAVRSRHGTTLMRAGQAVVIERMLGQLALMAVTLTGFAVALSFPGGIGWPERAGWAVAVLVAGLGVLVLARARLGALPVIWRMVPVLRATVLAPGVWQRQMALGLCIVACNLAIFAFCARATGTELPIEAVVTLVPLILAAMLLPIGVGGWGWREGAAAGLFPLIGAGAGAGLAASLAFGLVLLFSSLPGALWILGAKSRVAAE